MEAAAGIERRRHTRKKVEVEVLVGCGDNPAKGTLVSVYDLSLSGMAILPSGVSFTQDDKVCLCLSKDRGACSPDHIIEGTVVHTRNGLVGIRFDSVGIHILDDIHRLLRDGRVF